MLVPSSFADFFTDKDFREYTGNFWYETAFFVSGEWRDKEIGIRFAAAAHRATVFVNGIEITSHEGGFLPFTAEVGGAVRWDKYTREHALAHIFDIEPSNQSLSIDKNVLAAWEKIGLLYDGEE